MKRDNRGFTLVELLVVIAIIGILVALLLPAIQAAREAARRAQCINNLKQVGIALQNYHDTNNHLPIGAYSCCNGTWVVPILPFLEEQQLADMYQFMPETETTFDPLYWYDKDTADAPSINPPMRNFQVTSKRIATLTCPSDTAQVTVLSASGVAAAKPGLTLHNYVANFGNTNHSGGQIGAGLTAIKYLGSPFVGQDDGGNVQYNRYSKFKQISDGLSKTMMVSETVQGQNGDLRGLIWWGWSAGFESYGATPNGSDTDKLQKPEDCVSQDPNPPCAAQAGALFYNNARSRHKGGVNVVMCDASVQFVVDDCDLTVWRAASTSKGEEVYSGLLQ